MEPEWGTTTKSLLRRLYFNPAQSLGVHASRPLRARRPPNLIPKGHGKNGIARFCGAYYTPSDLTGGDGSGPCA
jgi:hypothetical protein